METIPLIQKYIRLTMQLSIHFQLKLKHKLIVLCCKCVPLDIKTDNDEDVENNKCISFKLVMLANVLKEILHISLN